MISFEDTFCDYLSYFFRSLIQKLSQKKIRILFKLVNTKSLKLSNIFYKIIFQESFIKKFLDFIKGL